MKFSRKIVLVFGITILLIGIGFLTYPSINNYIFVKEQQKTIDQYVNDLEIIKAAEPKTEQKKTTQNENKSTTNKTDYEKLRKAVTEYNQKIFDECQIGLSIEKSYQTPSLDLDSYGLSNNIYGYIEIPDIDVKMGILLGSNDYNMSLGATHMNHTSIPYGGVNTNSVIAAHCGYSGRHMFRYISKLQIGAVVKITTPFDVLTYSVSQIKIIDPYDTESLIIQKNKDMVTLLTCHPYPTNKYRCAVFCERK